MIMSRNLKRLGDRLDAFDRLRAYLKNFRLQEEENSPYGNRPEKRNAAYAWAEFQFVVQRTENNIEETNFREHSDSRTAPF